MVFVHMFDWVKQRAIVWSEGKSSGEAGWETDNWKLMKYSL